jgi:glucose-6-phosphate isomerase
MGQYVQEGRRNLIETVLQVKKPRIELTIQEDPQNIDGLNFLAGKTMDEVNKKAFQGTVLAHVDGGVPNLLVELDEMNTPLARWFTFSKRLARLAGTCWV